MDGLIRKKNYLDQQRKFEIKWVIIGLATSIAHLHAYICMCMKKRLFCKKQFHHDQLNQPFFGPAEVGVEAFELEAEEPSLALSAPSISFKSLSLVSCCICFSYSLTSLTAKQSKWIKKTFHFFTNQSFHNVSFHLLLQ